MVTVRESGTAAIAGCPAGFPVDGEGLSDLARRLIGTDEELLAAARGWLGAAQPGRRAVDPGARHPTDRESFTPAGLPASSPTGLSSLHRHLKDTAPKSRSLTAPLRGRSRYIDKETQPARA